MLSKKDLKHIASLARIELTKKEEERLGRDLSSILDYVKKLNELDIERVEPLYQIHSTLQDGELVESTTGVVNALRPDTHRKDFEMNEELNEKLIGQTPHSQNRFIKVKSVLKK